MVPKPKISVTVETVGPKTSRIAVTALGRYFKTISATALGRVISVDATVMGNNYVSSARIVSDMCRVPITTKCVSKRTLQSIHWIVRDE